MGLVSTMENAFLRHSLRHGKGVVYQVEAELKGFGQSQPDSRRDSKALDSQANTSVDLTTNSGKKLRFAFCSQAYDTKQGIGTIS